MSKPPCPHCGDAGFIRRTVVVQGRNSYLHCYCGADGCNREWKEPDPRAVVREVSAHKRRPHLGRRADDRNP